MAEEEPIEGVDEGAPAAATASAEEPQSDPSTATFPSGTKLSMRDALTVLGRRLSYVVAIVGPYESGKTSLVAGLYDLFQEGPVGAMEFAGSQTLHALELASHHSRVASGRMKPDSERTAVGAAGFYHLDVVRRPGQSAVTLLLGDRAGEDYRAAGDDVDLAREFPELGRADVIALLADGERLVDLEARHNVPVQLELMLRSFIEAGVTTSTQCLCVVLTKVDAVRASDQAAVVDALFGQLVDKLRKRYGRYFAAIEPFEVAAAPRADSMARGAGVADLLEFWLAGRSVRRLPPLPIVATLPKRAIGRVSIVNKG